MVMLSSTLRGRVLRFHSSAVAPNTLLIAELEGEEEISRPYVFHLDLVSARADLDYEALLSHPASIGIKQGIAIRGSASRGVQTLRIHGVLSAIEQGEKGDDWVVYRATLVPRLWRLSLNTRSRIFMDKTVPEIVAEVLQGNGFEPDDFEFRTAARPYPHREFVVQYQESDLQFISRWLEHEGIFYFFKQEDEREKVVFADGPTYESILGDGALRYHPEGQLGEGAARTQVDWFAPERVQRFQCRFQLTPKEVVLRDYNWRTPGVDLTVTSEVAQTAFGTAYHYGDHYKDQDEGKALAQIRAEELKCRQKVFQGTGDGRSFHAGSTFQLENHYRAEFNAACLLTSVKHRATQAMVLGAPVAPTASYENEFVAIPADMVYRPARVTPRPRIPGTIHAKVDATEEGEYAELDEQGRYKVRLIMDLSDRGGGTASRWIRKAEPYAGANYGMHFPLHKGTEVALAFVGGDPDRPFIVGALPDPEKVSPVKNENQTQSLIKSAGNNGILCEDIQDAERLLVRAQKDLELRAENNTHARTGNDYHLTIAHNRIERVNNDHYEKIDRDHVAEIGGSRHLTITANESVDIGGKSSLTVAGDVVQVFLGNHSEETSGNCCVKADHLVLEAASGITFKCGPSRVVLNAGGVTLAGPALTLDGATTKINSGPGAQPASTVLGKAATPIAALTPIEPGDLKVAAATAAGAGGGGGETAGGSSWISIELKDSKGAPVPKELYEVTLPDGGVVRGRLDKDGKAMVKGIPQGQGKITFPRLDKGNWRRG